MTAMESISASLSQLEQALSDALAAVEHRERLLDARELEMVQQAEQLTVTARIRQAERLGRDLERQRVLDLIALQQEMLKAGGTNAVLLGALRRQILEAGE